MSRFLLSRGLATPRRGELGGLLLVDVEHVTCSNLVDTEDPQGGRGRNRDSQRRIVDLKPVGDTGIAQESCRELGFVPPRVLSYYDFLEFPLDPALHDQRSLRHMGSGPASVSARSGTPPSTASTDPPPALKRILTTGPQQHSVHEEQLGSFGVRSEVRIFCERDDLTAPVSFQHEERLAGELGPGLFPYDSAQNQIFE